jgi:glycosyltransferase involved in cell wall biosynthesis
MLVASHLHTYLPYRRAGGEVTTHALLAALAAAGHEVHVTLTDVTGPDFVLDGVNVHPYVDRRQPLHWIPRSDLVVSHMFQSPRATLLAQKYRIPSVHICHSTWPEARRFMAYKPDMLVFNTDWVAEEFSDMPGARITVHPPVDPDRYLVDRAGAGAITIVNPIKAKGSDTFYALAERFPDHPFLAVQGGYGVQDLRDLPNVEILDPVDDMREVYARTKVVLMPSHYESWGRVAVEAAVSGIPSIVAPTPGLIEAMAEGAYYATPEDTDTWARLLKKLLTSRGWSNASKRALARAEQIEQQRQPELDAWVAAAEDISRRLKGVRR